MARLVRQVQEGLDNIINHLDKFYKGKYREVFKIENHDKAYYEFMQESGFGLAAQRGEGAQYTTFDTLDQDWVFRKKMIVYEIANKITLEAQRFNLYQDLIPRIIKEGHKAHEGRKDWDCANILNNGFDVTNFPGPDGKALFDDDHPIPGTTDVVDNLLAQDFDQDALEQACILIDKFKNPDGLQGDYEAVMLVYPEDIQYEVQKVLGSVYEPGTANNAINPMYAKVKKAVKWKRLSDKDSFFILTDAPNGLCLKENMPVTAKQTNDQNSPDAIISLISIYRALFEDFRLGVGSAGV